MSKSESLLAKFVECYQYGTDKKLDTVYDQAKEIVNGKTVDIRNSNMLIDIDGCICTDIPNEEPERMPTAKVYDGAVAQINRWYESNSIAFFTARTEEHRQITEEWLNRHGFKYHKLLMGKQRGGEYVMIDNHHVRGIRFNGKWSPLKKVSREIIEFS